MIVTQMMTGKNVSEGRDQVTGTGDDEDEGQKRGTGKAW